MLFLFCISGGYLNVFYLDLLFFLELKFVIIVIVCGISLFKFSFNFIGLRKFSLWCELVLVF